MKNQFLKNLGVRNPWFPLHAAFQCEPPLPQQSELHAGCVYCLARGSPHADGQMKNRACTHQNFCLQCMQHLSNNNKKLSPCSGFQRSTGVIPALGVHAASSRLSHGLVSDRFVSGLLFKHFFGPWLGVSRIPFLCICQLWILKQLDTPPSGTEI